MAANEVLPGQSLSEKKKKGYSKRAINFSVPHLTPMLEPRASNCSEIWKASSRVGVRTRVCSRWAQFSSDCRMGNAKAPVFPEPVSARPITSFPVAGSHGGDGRGACWDRKSRDTVNWLIYHDYDGGAKTAKGVVSHHVELLLV